MIKSPCIGVCTTTALGDNWCGGCGRHYMDVINWNGMLDAEKQAALDKATAHATRIRDVKLSSKNSSK